MNTDIVKARSFPENNYRGTFIKSSGKTIRQVYDSKKPISPLKYSEFYDIAFNTLCFSGCEFCYTNARTDGKNFTNLSKKINDWIGGMTENEKPFQVAIGGAGEPTANPEFVDALKAFHDNGVVPNYTTNAMHLTDDIIEATKKYCGGVAISCHDHLEKYWREGIEKFTNANIKTSLHIIIGEEDSVDKFWKIYQEFKDVIHYFVILPYAPVGRAKYIDTSNEFEKLFNSFKIDKPQKIAFGALFYEYFLKNPDIVKFLDVDMYEPEILSGYVMLDEDHYKDGKPIVYKSSFDWSPKF